MTIQELWSTISPFFSLASLVLLVGYGIKFSRWTKGIEKDIEYIKENHGRDIKLNRQDIQTVEHHLVQHISNLAYNRERGD